MRKINDLEDIHHKSTHRPLNIMEHRQRIGNLLRQIDIITGIKKKLYVHMYYLLVFTHIRYEFDQLEPPANDNERIPLYAGIDNFFSRHSIF